MYYLGIILAHLIGDYILQSTWMATEKTRHWWPALVHASLYTVPYIVLVWWGYAWSFQVLAFFAVPLFLIGATHYFIDRYRLARPLKWALNQIGPKSSRFTWAEAKQNNGFPESVPVWLSAWLMFIADNTLHLIINTALLVGWAAFL